MKTSLIQFRIEPAIKQELEALAAKDHRELGDWCRVQALKALEASKEAEKRATKKK
jgi:hypothetical protein